MNSVFRNWKDGAILLTDAGWGDSGKGKCVSALKAEIGAKIIGGHNAGHTIVTDKGEFGLGLIPSTIINKDSFNLIGQEVVINPLFLINEISGLKKLGIAVSPKNLMIDARSHVVMKWHEVRDALSEEARGKGAIGSLHLGVGWTYSDRVNRRGLRLEDILAPDWKKRVRAELKNQIGVIEDMAKDVKRKTGVKSKVEKDLNEREIIKDMAYARKFLSPFVGNTIDFVWKALDKNKKIVFEDSHGAMLEVSHGSWPFTTGVNTSVGALHRSFGGKAVRSLKKIIVSVKAYQTRVGGGPLPTENFGHFGNYVRKRGSEVGTRSGRARRCGPFDAPAIRYGLNIVGAGQNDEIALTKLDVLSGLNKIPVCVAYKHQRKIYAIPPRMDAQFLIKVRPQYEYLPGWKEDISGIRKFESLPKEAKKYILFIQKLLGRKITLVGVGKHQGATILPRVT